MFIRKTDTRWPTKKVCGLHLCMHEVYTFAIRPFNNINAVMHQQTTIHTLY